MPINLPVLAQSRRLRFSVFTAYYTLQGLPVALTFISFPVWLTGQGIEILSNVVDGRGQAAFS